MAASHKTAEALRRIDDQLECAICLQSYTDPKLLSCFHTFCRHCLEGLVVEDQGTPVAVVTCPKCRQSTPVPRDGIGTLQSACHVHHLFDIRDMLRKATTDSETIQCEKCNEALATAFCRDCGKYVCVRCTEIHHKWDELTTHQIVSIDDVQAGAAGLRLSKVKYCPKHPESHLKIYCETCQELICTDCTVRLHRGHQYDLVADSFPRYKDELQAHLQSLEQKLSLVNERVCDVDRRMNEVKDQKLTIEADIDKRVKQLHQALDQRREELLDQLDKVTQQTLKSLAAHRDEIEMLQTRISSCLEYVKGSLKTGTEGETLAMKAPLLKQMQQVTAKITPDTLRLHDIVLVERDAPRLTDACHNFAAIRTIDLTQCHASGPGLKTAMVGERVDIRLHTKDKKTGVSEIEAGDITAELLCCETGAVTNCGIRRVKEGEFKIRYWPSVFGRHQLSIMIWGRHIRDSPYSVVVQTCMSGIRSLVGSM